MEIFINKHSSIKISGEKTVYFDPFELDKAEHDADVVFVTHSHYDHFSPEDIKKCADENTAFVVPVNCGGSLKKAGFENTVLLSVGEEKIIAGIPVKAVPAYNKIKPFHKKSEGWLGYVIEIDGEKIYVAGDTDALDENLDIVCDTALVPAGGMFTMDCKKAAEFINAMKVKPKKAIPTHYGSVAGNPEDGKRFAELVDADIKTEILI